jgi:ketosteroid isomerase-like protein
MSASRHQEKSMPSKQRLHDFIATVEAGEYVRAIEEFYADDATMRENVGAPRKSRTALVAHERMMLKNVESIKTRPAQRIAVDGDIVVINWIFDITARDGNTRVLDELAIQRWHNDKIVEEQFYYDASPPRT